MVKEHRLICANFKLHVVPDSGLFRDRPRDLEDLPSTNGESFSRKSYMKLTPNRTFSSIYSRKLLAPLGAWSFMKMLSELAR